MIFLNKSDWKPIEEVIQKHYNKGHKKTGRPFYSRLLLFKISFRES